MEEKGEEEKEDDRECLEGGVKEKEQGITLFFHSGQPCVSEIATAPSS